MRPGRFGATLCCVRRDQRPQARNEQSSSRHWPKPPLTPPDGHAAAEPGRRVPTERTGPRRGGRGRPPAAPSRLRLQRVALVAGAARVVERPKRAEGRLREQPVAVRVLESAEVAIHEVGPLLLDGAEDVGDRLWGGGRRITRRVRHARLAGEGGRWRGVAKVARRRDGGAAVPRARERRSLGATHGSIQ